VQKELNETVIRSREEIEERLETEDRQQLGDISDEVYIATHPHPKFHLRLLFPGNAKRSRCLFSKGPSRPIARARRCVGKDTSRDSAVECSLRNHSPRGSRGIFLGKSRSISVRREESTILRRVSWTFTREDNSRFFSKRDSHASFTRT